MIQWQSSYILNFAYQIYSLYSEDFSIYHSLKLFPVIQIAYNFYNQTLSSYNKKAPFGAFFHLIWKINLPFLNLIMQQDFV